MEELKIPYPLFKEIIEEMMPFHKFLGFELLEAADGYVKLKIPFREEFVGDPRSKRIHGGLVATAIDSVGGAAAMSQMTSDKDKMATVDMRIDYLSPGKPEDLIAEGTIIRKGNRIIVTEMKIYHKSDADKTIAVVKGIYHYRGEGDDC